jgi:serine protease
MLKGLDFGIYLTRMQVFRVFGLGCGGKKIMISFQKNLVLRILSLLLVAMALSACENSQGPTGVDNKNNNQNEASDRYIVVLRQRERTASASDKVSIRAQVKATATSLADQYELRAAENVFSDSLQAVVFQMNAQQADALRENSAVAYVEKDQPVSIMTSQSGATWGLDRLDQNNLPLNQRYEFDTSGVRVNAYVIDTGILPTHDDATDCNGHGTHVAGTIGSRSYGVAKNINLIGVRVLDCAGSGSYASVIAGVEWVTAHHKNPAVANMSLGGPISQALEDAIAGSIQSGVTFVVAAGNDNRSACLSSPAHLASAIRVGSTTSTDQRSSFSNFGECVDLFAPGSEITSTWSTSTSAVKTISGTSMATPHVAGVAALYLAKNPNATPNQVKTALIDGSLVNKVGNPGLGSPNRLLNTLFLAAPSAPPIADKTKLQNGISTEALSGARGEEKRFTFEVPAGKKNLLISISGGTGDADLYIKRESAPTISSYDCRPYKGTNSESCAVSSPIAGVYSIMIRGYAAYSGVFLKAIVE